MRSLKIGDMIAVFEPVFRFGRYEPHGKANLLEIKTNRTTLQLLHQHLIFVMKRTTSNAAVLSASVRVIDHIVFGDDSVAVSESSKPLLIEDRLVALFTPSGKLLVNGGLLVSTSRLARNCPALHSVVSNLA
jgi:hypothetical protein